MAFSASEFFNPDGIVINAAGLVKFLYDGGFNELTKGFDQPRLYRRPKGEGVRTISSSLSDVEKTPFYNGEGLPINGEGWRMVTPADRWVH